MDLFAKRKLVVASIDPSTGLVDSENSQPLSEWNRGERNASLINLVHGNTLFDILKDDLNLIRYDSTTDRFLPTFITYKNRDEVEQDCMRMLGKIAEALIVKACHTDIHENRIWAKYARRGKRRGPELDDYIAIGTGLYSTLHGAYPTKYSPNDTQRDILWINKKAIPEEMTMIKSKNRSSALAAGLQIKVSRDGFRYIYRKDIARSRYEIPLVYFDLKNDFQDLANAIYREERDIDIGYDFIRGSDINYDIHDQLYSYYYLLKEILIGKFPIEKLLDFNETLNTVTKMELQEQEDPYGSILLQV